MSKPYEVVIVGGGITGAVVAHELGRAGKRVLILEAGPKLAGDRQTQMERFFLAMAKASTAVYPEVGGHPTQVALYRWRDPDRGYLVQNGPVPFKSDYNRHAGGTTSQWLGTCLRLLPSDFAMQSTFGRGVDWPMTYDELEPWYRKAELALGIAAAVEEQAYLGVEFPARHRYPLPGIPPTLVDQKIAEGVEGMQLYGAAVQVSGTPAARNSIRYDDRPACAGSTSCTPICPTRAKYEASFTLDKALQTGSVEIMYQTVADRVVVESDTGRVAGIHYVQYGERPGAMSGSGTVTATRYLLAANAIEVAKLLLNSATDSLPQGTANQSGEVGRNLMDHPVLLNWALMPEAVYPYRGPQSTSGIESLRNGSFRRERAAFRIEIGNEGWSWAQGSPYTDLHDFVDGTNRTGLNPAREALIGGRLRDRLRHETTRQVRLGFLVEQMPLSNNRVVSSEYRDALGIRRPELTYDLCEYTKAGLVAARETARAIFQRLAAVDYTWYDPADPGYLTHSGEALGFQGAGHCMGTHRMGNDRQTSVVDKFQRSWDHENLFLTGCGVLPTCGTANPTLTAVALALWAARTIQADLG